MSKRGDLECVSDINQAIKRIEAYTKDINYQEFLEDIKTQDAVVRNLEIIGEAAKNISAAFKKKHKSIEWKSIAGMRDKLIHHYFGVSPVIVWGVVKEKLPELRRQLESILRSGAQSRSRPK